MIFFSTLNINRCNPEGAMVARDTIWNDHPGFSLGRRLPCSAAACLEILAVSREGQNNSYFYVFFALKQFNTAEISLLTWPDLSSATPMQAINLTLTGCNMLVESYIYTYIHTSHHITSHHTTPHHTTPHHTTSHHITSHHTVSHHITSHTYILRIHYMPIYIYAATSRGWQ